MPRVALPHCGTARPPSHAPSNISQTPCKVGGLAISNVNVPKVRGSFNDHQCSNGGPRLIREHGINTDSSQTRPNDTLQLNKQKA